MAKNPGLEVEQAFWQQGQLRIAGVDEVGLGSLCGPIVAAAVLLPAHCPMIAGVRDSKLLSAAQRDRLFTQILNQATSVGVGIATVAEIEQFNVLRASHLAMQRSLRRIAPIDHALIDGREIKKADLGAHTAIVDGDASSYAIACASIIAKVRRDRFLKRLAKRHPGYGWERNAGYGTKEHLNAIEKLGITPFHRRSYAPIQKALLQWE
ncbi:ribonuclease HII [Phormidesmis priestleyi ULC007]|uniref:Ribonuclease HII n=1 Tax=Phormidesmis priestleyi ULC007 TaxID=1920490 RepID=A0A2T1DP37_9CYAN|nr:ribonuclease HII [Phormidesmis priestleyi]PSB22211.1 ribonuclease HII [Phormidesmis priestleyi ULC007]PZO52528.1 MAG: ribonuclease HII [Phormidesmis priestleyi]